MNRSLKQQIRNKYLLKLKNLTPNEKNAWDKMIFNNFINSNYFKENHVFAIYWSLPHEVNTHEIIKFLLAANKQVCLPRMVGKTLVFYYISDVKQIIVDNKFSVGQPSAKNQQACLTDIEIFIVPLIAYDNNNHRIGYGKGFYDRFFKNQSHAVTIGLAYEMQLIKNENYINDKWDVPLSLIITNK